MPISHDAVFDRIIVDHMIRGVTRVSWALNYLFQGPPPYTFQLQFSFAGHAAADDWVNVGTTAVNTAFAVDDTPRLAGNLLESHYRVILTDGDGVAHTSQPVSCYGKLGVRDWLLAAEQVRRANLRDKFASIAGWLLKRRRRGDHPVSTTRRNMQVDPITHAALRSNAEGALETFGTEYIGGYFAPYAFSVDIPGGASNEVADNDRGAVDDAVRFYTGCQFLLFPYISARDIFVEDGSDRRFRFGEISEVLSHRGVPLIGRATLELLPFSDIAYQIEVPEARE